MLKINMALTLRNRNKLLHAEEKKHEQRHIKENTRHICRRANSSDVLTQCFLHFPGKISTEFIAKIQILGFSLEILNQ